MKTCTRCVAVAVTFAVVQSQSIAQLQDLYVTNDIGTIYQIDGQTLHATEVAQLRDAGATNEILYMGNGQLVANLGFGVVSYDLNSNIQTTLFTGQDINPEPGSFSFMSGLALRSTGDIYFTSRVQAADGSYVTGTTYNPTTQVINQIPGSPRGILYMDHYEISPDRMLGLRDGVDNIDIFNPSTGVLETVLDSFIPQGSMRSIVESNGQMYILTDRNDIFTLDITNGNTEFYGSITGTTRALFGMTVPAPSSLGLLGLGLGLYTRRRR